MKRSLSQAWKWTRLKGILSSSKRWDHLQCSSWYLKSLDTGSVSNLYVGRCLPFSATLLACDWWLLSRSAVFVDAGCLWWRPCVRFFFLNRMKKQKWQIGSQDVCFGGHLEKYTSFVWLERKKRYLSARSTDRSAQSKSEVEEKRESKI